SACASARAPAIVPIVSLDRCMAFSLDLDEFEINSAGFRALSPNAMPDRLLGTLRDQALELGLGLLVLKMSLPGAHKDAGNLRPGIGAAHIDKADCLDSRLRRIHPKEGRGLAVLDTPPELPLRRDHEVLVEGIGMGGDLHPFAAAGNYGENRRSCRYDPH